MAQHPRLSSFYVFVLTFGVAWGDPMLATFQGSVVHGVYSEMHPVKPVFYDTFIPLIYEFQTPYWNKSDVTFTNWFQCSSETHPYRYTCPVVYHMNNVVVNLHSDFESIQPVTDINQSANLHQMTEHSTYCDNIRPHFPSRFLKERDFETYLKSFENCHPGSGLNAKVERNISTFNYNFRSAFTKMENNFYNTMYKGIQNSTGPNHDLVASAVLSNLRTALQGSTIGMMYAEKKRWVHAFMDCHAKMIPNSVVLPARLNESLYNITQSLLDQEGTPPVLSVNLDSTSSYYSLPLTDCAFTNQTLVVRILVPTVRQSKVVGLSLVQLHPVSFLFDKHLCEVNLRGQISDGDHPFYYLYDTYSGTTYRTNCQPGELCQVSDYILSRNRDACATALMSEKGENVRRDCPLMCRPRANVNENAPLNIHRVSPNKYILTGTQIIYNLHCGNSSSKSDNIDFGLKYGALEVTIPCKCKLVIGSSGSVLYSEGTCTEDSIVATRVVPVHFTKLPGTKGEDAWQNNIENGNLTSYINLTNVALLYLPRDAANVYNIEDMSPHSQDAQKQVDSSSSSSSTGTIWAVLITLFTILLGLQIFVLFALRKMYHNFNATDERILFRYNSQDTEPIIR